MSMKRIFAGTNKHYVKIVCIRRFSGRYFPAFELNMERYSVPLHMSSKCGKIRTENTPNTGTFHAVKKQEYFATCMIPDTGGLSILFQASMMDCFKKTVKS